MNDNRRANKLFNLGLYKKVYSLDGEKSKEYPFEEWGYGEERYYKKLPIDVTEESYQKLTKFSDIGYETGNNIIAKIITVVAWVVFIGGFVLGIIVGSNTGNPLAAYAKYEPEFNFLSAIFCWAGAFISGILLLGFAEIIKMQETQNYINKENFRKTQFLTAQMMEILRSLNEIKDK